MANQKEDNKGQFLSDVNTRLSDLEERNNMLRDRLLLIGQNLIDIKEKLSSEMLDIKKDNENMKNNIARLASFLESLSGELPKFAKREDLEILAKQARMFQPLEIIRKKDLKK